MTHDYDDIIHLPHHVSEHHPPMPMESRAAQFAPFAALTGHEAALRETARETQAFQDLVNDSLEQLDRKMAALREQLAQHPKVRITHFRPDGRKRGGAYVQTEGCLMKLREHERMACVATPGGTVEIAFDHIVEIAICGAYLPEFGISLLCKKL